MIVDSIADYIEDNSSFKVNKDLFLGELPLDVSNCVSLVPFPSPDPSKATPIFSRIVSVRGRFAAYKTGFDAMQSLYDLLHGAANYKIDGFHVFVSYAQGQINDNGRDDERRHLFSLDMAFVVRVDEGSS